MMEFEIRLTCVQDVQAFVSLATSKAFPVSVRDLHMTVNGKSFMEMFCLNFTHPLFVCPQCGEDQLLQLKAEMGRFLA